MNLTCCDIPAYLKSFPETWRKELTALLCDILDQKMAIDCRSVKDCETLTFFSNFNFTDSKILLSYIDERGTTTTRDIDLSGLLSYQFENGISESNGTVRLGNDLLMPTIIGNTNTNAERITNSLWIRNNTAIGEESPLDATKLRVVSYGNFNVDGGAVNVDRVITAINGSPDVDKEAYATSNRLLIYNPIVGTNTSNSTLPTSFGELGTALRGAVQYVSPTADITSAISAVSASYFLASADEPPGSGPQAPGGGDITSLIGFIARSPRQLADNPSGSRTGDYNGTIEDTFGLFIEPQRSQDSNISTAQTRTWGVYQSGDTDRNHFYGNTSFGPENRNEKSTILTTRYGNYMDDRFALTSIKAFLTPATASSIGDSFATTISKLDVYSPQTAAVGFQIPTVAGVVHNAISSYDAQNTYASQNADITAALVGFKSNYGLSSGLVEVDDVKPSPNGGDIETIIGFLCTTPLQIQDNSSALSGIYTGTINNTFGLFIESQRSPDATGGPTGFTQTNTWGVYQSGDSDVNYFNGRIRLTNTSCPIFADDTEADAALQSGEIYRLTGDRTIYMKP